MVTTVTLVDGERAVLESHSRFRVPGKVMVRLATGQQVIVPESALIQTEEDWRLPFASGELTAGGNFRVIETSAETEARERPSCRLLPRRCA